VKRLGAVFVLALAAPALAACSTPTPEPDDGLLSIVASTNVYGSIAQAIAGDHAEITSIISSPAQDPHSYEATARDRLAVSKADLVIVNGGGYDPFMDALLAASSNDERVVIDAVETSGLELDDNLVDRISPFNEHVWYSIEGMRSLAMQLAQTLSQLDPEDAAAFDEELAAFDQGLDGLTSRVTGLKAQYNGTVVAATEPVPGYLLWDAGLYDYSSEFAVAIEEGRDVPVLVLRALLSSIEDHRVKLLVVNEQTTSPEVTQVVDAAGSSGVPVVTVTETLPAGIDYLDWMSDNVSALEAALETVPR
jgi:zinc/manganese transport system substrate-binding protein